MTMNHFFYESSSKEKVKELRAEGQRSQEFYRSGAPKIDLLRGLPKLIFALLGILAILGLLVR
jgi:hypothetical protein